MKERQKKKNETFRLFHATAGVQTWTRPTLGRKCSAVGPNVWPTTLTERHQGGVNVSLFTNRKFLRARSDGQHKRREPFLWGREVHRLNVFASLGHYERYTQLHCRECKFNSGGLIKMIFTVVSTSQGWNNSRAQRLCYALIQSDLFDLWKIKQSISWQ